MTEEIITASMIVTDDGPPYLCNRCRSLDDSRICYTGEDGEQYFVCSECSKELIEKKRKYNKTVFDIRTKNKSKNSDKPTMR